MMDAGLDAAEFDGNSRPITMRKIAKSRFFFCGGHFWTGSAPQGSSGKDLPTRVPSILVRREPVLIVRDPCRKYQPSRRFFPARVDTACGHGSINDQPLE
jgi:hypothetical protein